MYDVLNKNDNDINHVSLTRKASLLKDDFVLIFSLKNIRSLRNVPHVQIVNFATKTSHVMHSSSYSLK